MVSCSEDSDNGEEARVADGDGVEFVGEDLEDEKKRPKNEGRNRDGGGEATGEESEVTAVVAATGP